MIILLSLPIVIDLEMFCWKTYRFNGIKNVLDLKETDDGVWAIFEDGSRELGDILVGADGINSPSKFNFNLNLFIFF